MTPRVLLQRASFLSIVLCTLHLTDDIVHGWEAGTLADLSVLPILVVWLYGTLPLGERRAGQVIMLLGSLIALVIPIIHMSGKGIGAASRVANTSGHYLFVWTLLALGVSGLFCLVLAVQVLLSPARSEAR